MILECKIKTPQFKNGRVKKMMIQSGYFDTKTFFFTPKYQNGHKVQFESLSDFYLNKV